MEMNADTRDAQSTDEDEEIYNEDSLSSSTDHTSDSNCSRNYDAEDRPTSDGSEESEVEVNSEDEADFSEYTISSGDDNGDSDYDSMNSNGFSANTSGDENAEGGNEESSSGEEASDSFDSNYSSIHGRGGFSTNTSSSDDATSTSESEPERPRNIRPNLQPSRDNPSDDSSQSIVWADLRSNIGESDSSCDSSDLDKIELIYGSKNDEKKQKMHDIRLDVYNKIHPDSSDDEDSEPGTFRLRNADKKIAENDTDSRQGLSKHQSNESKVSNDCRVASNVRTSKIGCEQMANDADKNTENGQQSTFDSGNGAIEPFIKQHVDNTGNEQLKKDSVLQNQISTASASARASFDPILHKFTTPVSSSKFSITVPPIFDFSVGLRRNEHAQRIKQLTRDSVISNAGTAPDIFGPILHQFTTPESSSKFCVNIPKKFDFSNGRKHAKLFETYVKIMQFDENSKKPQTPENLDQSSPHCSPSTSGEISNSQVESPGSQLNDNSTQFDKQILPLSALCLYSIFKNFEIFETQIRALGAIASEIKPSTQFDEKSTEPQSAASLLVPVVSQNHKITESDQKAVFSLMSVNTEPKDLSTQSGKDSSVPQSTESYIAPLKLHLTRNQPVSDPVSNTKLVEEPMLVDSHTVPQTSCVKKSKRSSFDLFRPSETEEGRLSRPKNARISPPISFSHVIPDKFNFTPGAQSPDN